MFSYKKDGESGNVMVYLLIAIALFAALTMILSRQNDQGDGQNINDEQVSFRVAEILDFASAAQNVVDQMIFAGSELGELQFINPTSTGFNTPPNIHKIYHPSGGGLNYRGRDLAVFTGTDNNPPPGWYIGRFNSFEWTPTSDDDIDELANPPITGETIQDVVITAYQLSQPICAAINKKLIGSETIPALGGTGSLRDYLVDDAEHSGTNAEVTADVCATCANQPSMCVSNSDGDMWAFYSLIGVK